MSNMASQIFPWANRASHVSTASTAHDHFTSPSGATAASQGVAAYGAFTDMAIKGGGSPRVRLARLAAFTVLGAAPTFFSGRKGNNG